MTPTAPACPIAVVGVSALFPGSTDLPGFWRDIVGGVDRITDVPPTHWLPDDYYDPDPRAPDRTYCRRGAFLSPVDFDPLEFGIPPAIVPATDTAQLLALMVARAALLDYSVTPLTPMARARTSVILGVTSGQELLGTMVSRLQRPVWVKALREIGLGEDVVEAASARIAEHYVPWVESTFPGLLGNVVAGRIANRFDLGGSNYVTDAACASTLAALHAGIKELAAGEADVVLTGGADTSNDIFMFTCFSKTPALSPSGDCRPFSAAADGTMLGEGLGMLVLRRLADAERDGDHIWAVIRGVGSSSDGRAKSIYAPVSEGQARALSRAYAAAGVAPSSVELIEAHGTGTIAGDVAEFRGLTQVFAPEAGERRPWCALGSIKSQIGHTKAAAGAAGLLKAILALRHRVLPPSIKIERPDPRLGLEESAFYLNTTARPWIASDETPRRAGVSSFGFGGTNFHVVVEEYRGPAPRPPRCNARPAELVLLSAASPEALAAACREAADAPGSLQWRARSSQRAFDRSAAARLALVAADADALADRLRAAAAALAAAQAAPPGVSLALGPADPGGVAFACPGQGSQWLGMGAGLALHFEAARRVWDEAAAVLPGPDRLHDVAYPPAAFDDLARAGQRARLTATEWAQPALAAAGAAMLAVLRSCGLAADAAFGHSFGELTALHAAGALDLPGLLIAARRRGEAMRDAAAVPGAMAAVTGAVERVQAVLAEHPAVVIANHNTPQQVVIAGERAAVDRCAAALAAAGMSARPLEVATAFHSPIVAAASEAFAAALAEVALTAPDLPVISCSEVAPYPADAATARAWLAAQIARPVRFAEQVEALYARGMRTFVEIGPGRVLAGLVARCLDGRPHRVVALDDRQGDAVVALLRGLGELAVAGVALDFDGLWHGLAEPAPPVSAGRRLTLSICGANYGKPYPPPPGAPKPAPVVAPASVVAPAPAAAPVAPVVAPAPAAAPAASVVAPAPAAAPVASVVAPAPAFIAAPAPAVAAPPTPPSNPRPPVQPPMFDPTRPPPAASPTPPAPPAPAPAAPGWLDAHRDIFARLASAQAAYQQAMAETHLAYLQVAHASLAALHGVTLAPLIGGRLDPAALGTAQNATPLTVLAPAPTPSVPFAAQTATPLTNRAASAPPPTAQPATPLLAPASSLAVAPSAPAALASAAPPIRPVIMPAVAPAAAPVAVDPATALVAVVADKTGYPAEMLRLDMALESDLGVDSIKRVEILSALRERLPALPDLPPSALGDLRTLGDIVALLGAAPAPAPSAQAVDAAAALVAVVADKTGYPAEMLRLDMALESDLGVDSIKRVEILSALRERLPALPDLPPSALGDLRTLGDIVALLGAPAPAPAATPAATTPAPANRIGRHVPRLHAAPAAGLGLAHLDRGPIAIAADPAGVAAALAAALTDRGLTARIIADPAALPADAAALVLLDGLDPDDSLAAGRRALMRALAFARAFAPRAARGEAAFVTVQDTGGAFGLGASIERPAHAGLAAFTRCAALEWPATACRALDLARAGRDPRALAAAIADELIAGGVEIDVALAPGRRATVVAPRAPADAPADAPPAALPTEGIWLLTGGARGITPGLAEALARHGVRRLALVGRTPLTDDPPAVRGVAGDAALKRVLLADRAWSPAELRAAVEQIERAREIHHTLARLEAAGATARYLAVDLLDRAALGAALAGLRAELGPIAGVVHAAGVLADRRIADKGDEDFERVLATKVDGFAALIEATAADPVRALVVFSSIAARTGNVGQSDYAAANETLTRLALAERDRRGDGCLVKALGWGPWQGGMVTPALARHFAARGVPLIEPEIGAELFIAELTRAPREEVDVVLGALDWPLAESERVVEADVVIGPATAPDLADHAPAGAPVVPIALAIEWFARALAAHRPGEMLVEVGTLQVARGLKLPAPSGHGSRLRLTLRPLGADRYEATLTDRPGVPGMRAELVAGPRRALPIVAAAPLGPRAEPHGARFHGPAFDLLGRLDADATAASVAGVAATDWPGPHASDPAALDGALQLALAWLAATTGAHALPLSIERVTLHAAGPWPTPARCTLAPGRVDGARATCRLALTTAAGEPLAALDGVGLVVYREAEVRAGA